MAQTEKYRYPTFLRGLSNDESPTQIKSEFLSVARNVEIIKRGAVRAPRPGSGYIGNAVANNPTAMDGLMVYKNSAAAADKLLIVVNGTAKYLDEGTDNWTTIPGATFTTNYDIHTAIINNTLYMVNGTNPLTMFDGTTLTRFTLISPPSGLNLTRGASLPSGPNKISYRVTADNGIGETTATNSFTVQVNKARDEWNFDPNNPTANYSVTVSWASVANAIKYNIYGVTEGYETYLDSVEGGATSYIDYGIKIPSTLFTPPDGNQSQAPKGDIITIFKGSIVMAGDPDNLSRLSYSAGGDKVNSFTLGDGGGWIDINANADDGRIMDMKVFQQKLIVFKESSIWQFDFTDSLIPSINVVTKGVGAISKTGAINMGNDLAFIGKNEGGTPALYVLGNEPNLPDVLRTNELSIRIKPELEALPAGNYNDVALWYLDNRLYIAYAKGGASYNNTVLVYDREQLSFVTWDSLHAHYPTIWVDSENVSHVAFIDPSDNRVSEISSAYSTDKGTAIEWEFRLRQETGRDPERYKRVKWESLRVANTTGVININLYLDNSVTTLTKVLSATGDIATALGSLQIAYGNTIGSTESEGEVEIASEFAVHIPVHRLGINSVVQNYGVGLSGSTENSQVTLVERSFEWALLRKNKKDLSNILQI